MDTSAHTTLTQDPVVTDRPEQPYVGTTRTVRMTSMSQIADRIPELAGWLTAARHPRAGAPFLRFLVLGRDGDLTVEAGIPVDQPVVPDEDVHTGALPAGRYVTVTHLGHPDTLVAATGDVLRWADGQGLRFDVTPGPAGEAWGCRLERYLTDPRVQPARNRCETELAIRLAD